MSKIQNRPFGLLEILGVKSTGRNPEDLIQTVQPVLQTTDLYLSNRIETVQDTTGAVAGVDNTATVTVPTGQAWRVLTLSGLLSSFSGAPNCAFALGIRTADGQLNRLRQLPFDVNTATAGYRYSMGVEFGNPPVLPAGSSMQVIIDRALSVGTVILNVRALVQVLTP